MSSRDDRLVELLRNLIESKVQAEYDFCGEQRDWHLPRLDAAFLLAAQLFPLQMGEAMEQAKTPYGDSIAG